MTSLYVVNQPCWYIERGIRDPNHQIDMKKKGGLLERTILFGTSDDGT